jgi:hypothetical protein
VKNAKPISVHVSGASNVKLVIERSGGICERCKKNDGYAAHHLTYARMYQERLTDLIHLCEEMYDETKQGSDDWKAGSPPAKMGRFFLVLKWQRKNWSGKSMSFAKTHGSLRWWTQRELASARRAHGGLKHFGLNRSPTN